MARQPNVDLADAIDQWLEHREHFDDMKDGTLDKDRSMINSFRADVTKGLPGGKIDINTVDLHHVTAWRTHRSQARIMRNGKMVPLSPSTLNADVRVIKSFFAWTRTFGVEDPETGKKFKLTKVSPAAELKVKRVNSGSSGLLRVPSEEWPDLLDSATDPLHRWLIAVGLYTAQRTGEIRLSKWSDLDETVNQTGKRIPGLWINREKSTQRNAPMIRHHINQVIEFQEELERWTKFYRQNLASQGVFHIDMDWPLMPAYRQGNGRVVQGPDGKFVMVRTLNYAKPIGHCGVFVQTALHKLGFPTFKNAMHCLRRSAARAFHDELVMRAGPAGGFEVLPDSPIRLTMALLGHKSQDVTEDYIGIEVSRVALNTVTEGRRMIELRRKPEHMTAPAATGAPRKVRRLHVV